MMNLFVPGPKGLVRLEPGASPEAALWVDLYRPMPHQVAAVEALGLEVPTPEDMEEIEISNRLYRDEGVDVMTVVMPGHTPEGAHVASPVAFILTPGRLITVRHHSPRSFETFPTRAERSAAGCGDAQRIFVGLIEEIVARQADLLEGIGREMDKVAASVLGGQGAGPAQLRGALEAVGRQGELLGRIRLGLLTLERALSFFSQTLAEVPRKSPATGGKPRKSEDLRAIIKAQLRDINALEVHGDFLAGRVSLAVDATLGMINLEQNSTVRIVSVVAALFLPPTLIASLYGMNFRIMPELDWAWGYPFALGLMLASALGTWAFFRWKGWL